MKRFLYILPLLFFLSWDIPFGFMGGADESNDASFTFDGSAEYLEEPTTLWSDALTVGGDVTISIWFYTEVFQQQSLWTMRASGSNYLRCAMGAGMQLEIEHWDGVGRRAWYKTGDAISSGEWHHFLCVRKATNGEEYDFFLDGAVHNIPVAFSNQGSVIPTGQPIRIGTYVSGTWHWEGNLDHFAVWDSDQSANIADIYGSEIEGEGKPPDLSALTTPPDLWYEMNSDDELTITNGVVDVISGNNITGVNMDATNIDLVNKP